MALEELKQGEHETVEYKRDVPNEKEKYLRIAGVTRKAEPNMIKELQLEGTGTSFDTLQVVGKVTNDGSWRIVS